MLIMKRTVSRSRVEDTPLWLLISFHVKTLQEKIVALDPWHLDDFCKSFNNLHVRFVILNIAYVVHILTIRITTTFVEVSTDIVLTSEDYKFVLVEECPIKSADPIAEEVQASDKWVKVDKMARCYILASMANVLQHHHQSMTSSYNMLASLKEMFGEQNRAAKQTSMKALLTTKMAEDLLSENMC
ncbi:hypothetical protein KY285_010664 [Solanum tuberosum]|nr:hypothetical protein KY285_010664 [Solanum tuberosum]